MGKAEGKNDDFGLLHRFEVGHTDNGFSARRIQLLSIEVLGRLNRLGRIARTDEDLMVFRPAQSEALAELSCSTQNTDFHSKSPLGKNRIAQRASIK